MVNNPFKKELEAIEAEAPPALQAFTSRFLSKKSVQLSPDEIAQKIATLLRPGPPFYSKVQNSDLIANLSDASIMNSASLNPTKVANSNPDSTSPNPIPWTNSGTVWTALEGLPSGNKTYQIPDQSIVATASNGEDDDDDDDGLFSALMVTCDLDCKEVSLAKSVVVPTKVLHQHNYYKGNNQALKLIGVGKQYQWDDFNTFNSSQSNSIKNESFKFLSPSIDMWSWPSWVPFLGDKDKNESKDNDGLTKNPSSTPPSKDDLKKKKRVWIPSTTKVSFRAAWWGFTIALPPPIMAELDKDAAQAEKIANMINTALNYILNHLPPLPVGFLPIITVLKAIAPITGYLSTFIGWSWSELKSFDQGKGIELSATWILPVALIPRSWDSPTEEEDPEDPDSNSDQPEPPKGVDPSTPSTGTAPPTATPEGSPPIIPDPPAPQPTQPAQPVPAPVEPTPTQPAAAQPAQPTPEAPAPAPATPAPGATLPPTNPTDADLNPTIPEPTKPISNDEPLEDSPVIQAPTKGTDTEK